jgi:ribosome maturation factor RimP
MSEQHRTYRERTIELVEPIVESEGMELIEVECHRMKSRWLVRLFIDKEGGVTVDDCARISDQVGDVLDVYDIPGGAYNLEVSSPGLDRPLVRDKDFVKYKGSKIKVRTHKLIEGKRNFRGILVDYLQDEEGRYLIINSDGIFYRIRREIVSKANLEYEI